MAVSSHIVAVPIQSFTAPVIRSLESVIAKPVTCVVSVSEAQQVNLSLIMTKTPKTGIFSMSPITTLTTMTRNRYNH